MTGEAVSTGPRSAPSAGADGRVAGSMTVNVLPWPGALSTAMSPPSIVPNARLMDRPSPVPPNFRVVDASAWLNRR